MQSLETYAACTQIKCAIYQFSDNDTIKQVAYGSDKIESKPATNRFNGTD